MIVFALLSAFLPQGGANTAMSLLASLRFGLGFGIGGCYPLSAAKSSEETSSGKVSDRNFSVGVVFFWQTFGDIAPYLAGMLVVAAPTLAQFQIRS